MRFLGLDLGTTSFKGAVLDLERRAVVHVCRVPTPEPVAALPIGHHELNPDAVVAAVRRLIGELLADAPDATGLVMCGQMHCVVLADDRGAPQSNIITWKDQRAADLVRELRGVVSPEVQRQIGRELRPGLPVATLPWMQRHGLLRPGLMPASLGDFVLARLCNSEPNVEPTTAAAYGLFDLDRGDWHRELIEQLELAGLRWPSIRRFGKGIGTANVGGSRLTCFTSVGDQQCALAGVLLGERELSLNISTGSQVSLLSGQPGDGDFQVRPYFDGLWLRTIVQVPAGRSLAVLVNLLTELGATRDPWERIARETEQVGSTDLEVNLSFFASGFGDRGSIANIREDNLTVGRLFAAAFRSMAENYEQCSRRLSPDRAWDRLVFSGGVAQRFERLRREVLSRLGDPTWRLCPTEEDTLHGLLVLAHVCAGRAATVREATGLFPATR
ncbi:MAG TPA: FGGY family carbohydrate kinase [Gemmataceae bacterium]|nr:FGGY family carbohydrate kinase [Gemmataceae bacterium]